MRSRSACIMRVRTPHPPTASSRGGVNHAAHSMFSNVCQLCGASTTVQGCSCVCVSERTKCGASHSDQRRACDTEDGGGTHFILQNTKRKATCYQKGTGRGADTSPEQRSHSYQLSWDLSRDLFFWPHISMQIPGLTYLWTRSPDCDISLDKISRLSNP